MEHMHFKTHQEEYWSINMFFFSLNYNLSKLLHVKDKENAHTEMQSPENIIQEKHL